MGPDVTAVQYWQPYFAGEVDTGLWCYVLLSAHFATTKSTKLASAKAAERWGAPEKTAVQQRLQLTDSTAAWLYRVVLVVTVQHRQRRYQNVNTLTERIGKESVRQTQTKSSPTDRDRQEEEGFPLKNSRGRITSETFAGTDNCTIK